MPVDQKSWAVQIDEGRQQVRAPGRAKLCQPACYTDNHCIYTSEL